MKTSHLISSLLFFLLAACASPNPDQNETRPTSVDESLAGPIELDTIEPGESVAEINRQIQQNVQKLLNTERPNIVDYFMAMPHHWAHVDCDDDISLKRRQDAITYQNLDAGYLSTNLWQAKQIIVMYKSKLNGKTYIGQLGDDQCGDYFCGSDFEGFATLDEEGKWINVNEELLGQDTLSHKIWNKRGRGHSLLLPEIGTAIKILKCFPDTESEEDLGELVWVQTHFKASLNEAGKTHFAQK